MENEPMHKPGSKENPIAITTEEYAKYIQGPVTEETKSWAESKGFKVGETIDDGETYSWVIIEGSEGAQEMDTSLRDFGTIPVKDEI